MPAGRPLKFESVDELENKINEYFTECDSRTTKVLTKAGGIMDVPNPRPYTITGLALALDTTRETLLDYEGREEFSDTVKRAKMKCQNYAEEYLFSGSRETGAIFNLKNNYGWKDKNETDLHADGELKINLISYGNNDSLQVPTTTVPAPDNASNGSGTTENNSNMA